MIALIAVASTYLLLLAGKAVLAWIHVRRNPPVGPRAEFSDVTILQPILGGDPALADALGANVHRLPGARFVWLLDQDDGEAWKTCRLVVQAAPRARIEIVGTPPVPQGTNPKIFKLACVEAQVETHHVVVLDDDTRLSPAGLEALLAGLDAHDVSTALPLYRRGDNAPGRLLAQFVNTQSILTYLPLLVVAPAITLNGMCYALRTARLRALGGFAPLARRLTDDLAVARLVREAGGRIHQTVVPLEIGTTVPDWSRYVRVMHRWCVFAWLQVRAQRLPWRATILAVHGSPPLLLWAAIALAVHETVSRGDWIPLGVLGAAVSGRFSIIGAAQRMVARGVAHDPIWSLVSELLQPLHLLHALLSRRIHWRSRLIDVRADDDFTLR